MFEYIQNKNLRFTQSLKQRKSTNKIVLHHSAASADQTVEQIHNYHINHNDWCGIGYNLIVTADGQIFWGRGLDKVGAQCKGYNDTTIGICAIGNFMINDMPEAQKTALKRVVADLKTYYKLNANDVKGHRELGSTDCPGGRYPLDEIKNATNDTVNIAQPTQTTGYLVKITATNLNIRSGAGTNYKKVGSIAKNGVYTIVAEANGKGATKWGKLKSGAGWISLDYVTKL